MKTETKTLPTFFVGHGSPMNITADNQFTRIMSAIPQSLERPKAILTVSAHWITDSSQLTHAAFPKQIYDFTGFPEVLYNIKYQPQGSPQLVDEIVKTHRQLESTEQWGLDHGTWAVLYRMFPKQDIPVFQLSLNRNKTITEHLELARELKHLAEQNILILASGNIVHNLREIQWDPDAPAKKWAQDYEQFALDCITDLTLSAEEKVEKMFSSPILRQAHPTIEHLLPLVYAIGASNEGQNPEVLVRGIQNSTVSMASIKF